MIQVKPKRLTLSPHHKVNTVNDVILQLLEAGELERMDSHQLGNSNAVKLISKFSIEEY